MEAATVGFLAGILFAWPTWFVLMAVCLWSDYTDSRWFMGAFGLALGISSFNLFNLVLSDLLVIVPVSLFIGVFWSMWRWKRVSEKLVLEFKALPNREKDKGNYGNIYTPRKQLENAIDPTKSKARIVTWIMTWPFGMIVHVFDDIFDLIGRFFSTYLVGAFRRISANSLAKLDE